MFQFVLFLQFIKRTLFSTIWVKYVHLNHHGSVSDKMACIGLKKYTWLYLPRQSSKPLPLIKLWLQTYTSITKPKFYHQAENLIIFLVGFLLQILK